MTTAAQPRTYTTGEPGKFWRLRFAAPPAGDPLPPATPAPSPPVEQPPAMPATPVPPPPPMPAEQGSSGFPPNTAIADMTPEQQVEYWKHQARRHERAWQSVADKNPTPEQALAIRAALSDQEKATREAREQGEAEAARKMVPRLVAAEFRAAAAGRIPADRLTSILEPLDLTRFLTAAGEVDTDKVQQYVAGIAPADKKWPDMGQGRFPSHKTTGVSAGRELFAARSKK